MFCEKCGTRLSDEAKFCSNCGIKIEDKAEINENTLNREERVIKEGVCNLIKSRFYAQQGKAVLTNHQFIYFKHNYAKTIALGVLTGITSGKFDFAIPISEIESIEEGKQGIGKTIIINTKKGERYNFLFNKREEWKTVIQSAIQAAR